MNPSSAVSYLATSNEGGYVLHGQISETDYQILRVALAEYSESYRRRGAPGLASMADDLYERFDA